MGFAQRMTAANQRHGFFVVHPHVAEGGTNRCRRGKRVAAMIRPLRVHIDKSHLGRTQRGFCQFFRVAVRQPGFFVAPVHIQIRFPYVFTTSTKAKGTEAGVFQRHVTREDKQVGPGNFLAILLLNRPQQTAGFIQTHVVRPGVQWCKTLLSATCATASIYGAIGPCAVPCHADKQTGIRPPISRPPRLRFGHEGSEIPFQGRIVEFAKFFAVIEIFTQWVRTVGVLV